MKNRKGLELEARAREFFRGKPDNRDHVDFTTKTTLWEVKSCRLFNKATNSNHLRSYKHKRISGWQMGRFVVQTENHELIKRDADKEGKKAKYFFIIHVGNQWIFRTLDWEQIEMDENKEYNHLRISRIFKEI